MKKMIVLLVLVCAPLVSIASENPWIVGNMLYGDENCGEPIAFVDEQGNILAEFPPSDETIVGSQ